MAGERLSQSDNSDQLARQEVLNKISLLTDRLLEQSTPVIGDLVALNRTVFKVPSERVAEILGSGVRKFTEGHIHPITKAQYPVDNPDKTTIVVEDSRIPGEPMGRYIALKFRYNLPTQEFNVIDVILTPGLPNVASTVFGSEFTESDYDGHDLIGHQASTEELRIIFDIFEQNATPENLILSRPLMEELKSVKSASELEELTGEPTPAEKRWLQSMWTE